MTIRHIPAVGTPYAHIINTANSQWWNTDTASFEAFDAGNLADYAVLSGTQFGTTGIWPWTFPSGIAAGQYTVLVYDGDDDSLVEAGVVDWDGAALNVAADVRKVTGTAVTNVDDFKATGFLTTLGTNAPANWINAASIASNAFTTAKFADGVFTAAKFASDFFSGIYDYFTGSSRADAFKATGFAVAGDEMDIVDSPNATAVSAIQSGLSTFNAASDQVIVATNNDKTGYALSAGGLTSVTSWTVGITGNITGNLSGSVGSVTAAVETDSTSRTASKATAGEIRDAVGLGSANLDTQLGDLPTVAEFNARSLPSDDYFVVGDYTEPPTAEEIAAASEVFDTSTVQDTAPKYSKATATMQQLNSTVVGNKLRILKSDGSLMHERQFTSDANAEPVTGIGDVA